MNIEIVSTLLQVGGKLCSEIIRFQSLTPKVKEVSQPTILPPSEPEEIIEETTEVKIAQGTACLPCTNSHLHACVGLLDEASRMSPDGLNADSIVRVDKCLGEIAAAERVDLAPENIHALPEDQRKIADYAAKEIREIRHGLEGVSTKEDLEILTVRTSALQKHVGGEWFKLRLAKMPKQAKVALVEDTLRRLEEGV